jgi:hypothetical protein
LVSLFENQEAARASFRHVIDYNPASPFAASSSLWLQVIGDADTACMSSEAQSSPLMTIAAQLLRDWMERQLAGQPRQETPPMGKTIQEADVEQSRTIQLLQKQLRDRARQIGVLRSQLEALKLIDEDHQQRKRSVKIPTAFDKMDDRR